MKKLSLLLLIIPFLFSSCSMIQEYNNNANIINESKKENAVSVINAVIQNKRQFYCGEDESLLYLSDFNSSNDLYLTDDAKLVFR